METAWAAGLYEGEGCATFQGTKPRLSLKMTSEESVRRFHDVVGMGKVYGPYGPYQPNRTPFFMWVAEGVTAIEVGLELEPLVSGIPGRKLRDWLAKTERP